MSSNEALDISIKEIISIALVETNHKWKLTDFYYNDIYVLTYATEGSCTCYYKDTCREILYGDLMLYPPMLVRTTYTSPYFPSKFYAIKFSMEALNAFTQQHLSNLPVYLGNDHGLIQNHIEKLEEVWKGKRPGYMINCKSILLELLAQLLTNESSVKNKDHYKAYLKPVFEAIEKDILKNYSVSELAEIANLSPSYLRAIFKQYTGLSLIQYQNFLRMSHAHDLLRMNIYTVSEVAEMVGLSDYYFSRLFKKVIGISPSHVSYEEKYRPAKIPQDGKITEDI